MSTSLFRFSEVEAKKASPLAVNQMIKDVLKASDDACYIEMERFLVPPGVTGSRSFDQAFAIMVLLKHDQKSGKFLRTAMGETPQLTERVLWDRLQSVLRVAGFKVSHGRLVGLLEAPKEDEEDSGQPDID